ncbi:MAG: phage terminase large subunit [Pseudoflavonifractor sp.]
MTSQTERVKLTEVIGPSFYELHRDVAAGAHTYYKLDGGRGSLKSSFVGTEIPLGMMRDAQAGNLTNAVVFRRYKDNLHDSVYEQLVWAIDKLEVTHLWRQTLSPLRLTYIPTGQVILFRGADKVKKSKSIKVSKGYIKYLWFEELDEFENAEKIRSIQQSVVRGGATFTVFYSYNPPKSIRNWVNDPTQWGKPGILCHHSTYLTAPRQWLGEQFIMDAEHLRDTKPEAYAHEYLGEVTGSGNAIFDNVVGLPITDAEIKQFDRLYNGLDWGFYPDPWAFNQMHYDAARRTLYIFGELTRYKEGNRKTADALLAYGLTGADRITADSAEPKSVQDYKDYGLFCKGAIKGPGSVDYSHKWLQSLARIVIDPGRCPDTYREFSEYEYERTQDGEITSGYPDANNHHIDAVRYGMEPVWKRKGQ